MTSGELHLDRRNFLRWLGVAAASGVTPRVALAADDDLYDVGRFGNVRILHFTDSHAQLQPVYFREPSVNIGVGDMRGKPPHIVGGAFLEYFNIVPGGRTAHAFTFLDYQDAAHRYGRMGGFAHLENLDRPAAHGSRRRAIRSCSTAATSGRAPVSPMRRKAPTWSRPPTCSASTP